MYISGLNQTHYILTNIKPSFDAKEISFTVFLLIASVLGFTPASKSAQENLIHFWLFDGDLPNDTPLTAVETQFSVLENGFLTYHSALEGYPFDEDHPSWRKASMERRNAPTPLNYRPGGNSGLSFSQSNMRALQIKQPFTGDGGETPSILICPPQVLKILCLVLLPLTKGLPMPC